MGNRKVVGFGKIKKNRERKFLERFWIIERGNGRILITERILITPQTETSRRKQIIIIKIIRPILITTKATTTITISIYKIVLRINGDRKEQDQNATTIHDGVTRKGTTDVEDVEWETITDDVGTYVETV